MMKNFQFSIFNLQFKEKISAGFTLIELVVVMALLLITGTIVLTILNSTFNVSNKVKITNDLAQNGDYALSLMSNLIINSQQLVSYTPLSGGVSPDCTGNPGAGKSITLESLDGGAITLSCDDYNATISSSSAVFSSTIPTPTPYSSVSILDTTRVKVVANSCFISCTQEDPYNPPRIDIAFQLISANTTVGESAPTASFRTSVTLRNQNP